MKVSLNNLGVLDLSAVATINTNNDRIETAFDNTLSRNGTSPNQMSAILDMNNHSIINLPVPTSDTEPARKRDLDDAVIGQTIINNNTTIINSQGYEVADFSDGTSDMTSYLQGFLNLGKLVWLPRYSRFKITSSLIATIAGSGFISDGTAIIYMPAINFNNTNLSNKYASNSCGIYAHGDISSPYTPLAGFIVKGVKGLSEISDGRMVDFICARNVKDLVIEECDIYNFPVGCGIRASTLSGKSQIKNNHIHNFTSNASWPSIPQATGIEIDNDRINNTNTIKLLISDNNIHDIRHGPVILAAWGDQTDGINIQTTGYAGNIIYGNRIKNVGEGIDNFSTHTSISNNSIETVVIGIKLIHGASYCTVTSNEIKDAEWRGISVTGGSDASALNNVISSNSISSIDPLFRWSIGGAGGVVGSLTQTSCLAVHDGGTAGTVKGNLFIGNICDPGTYGMYNYFVSTTLDNFWKNNYDVSSGTVGFVTNYSIAPFVGSMIPANQTYIKAYINTAQSIAAADGTITIGYDGEVKDARGDWDAANKKLVVQIPGDYLFEAANIRFPAIASGSTITMTIHRLSAAGAGSNQFTKSFTAGSSGGQTFSVSGILHDLGVGDTVWAQLSSSDATSRALNAGTEEYSNISITQIR